MGWAAGFQTGSRVAGDILDTIQQAREQRMIREAQQRRDEATPLPFEMPAEQAPAAPARGLTFAPQTAEQLAVGALPTMERVTPADLGLVPAPSPVGAARFSYGGSERAGTVAEKAPGLYRRELADIVALRNPMEAERMRAAIEQSEVAAEQRAYELSQRPTRERLTQAQLTQAELGVKTAQQQAAEREAQTRAQEAVARLVASGSDITQAQIGAIAQQTGASPTFVTRSVREQWDVSDSLLERETKAFLKELGKAAVKGEAGVNEFLAKKFDPNPNDGIAPTLQKTKSGYQVVYGGQPLQGWGTYKDMDEFLVAAQGRIRSDELGVSKYLLDKRLKESQIKENEARAVALAREPREPRAPANPYLQKIEAFRAIAKREPTDQERALMFGLEKPDLQPKPMSMAEVMNAANELIGKQVMTPEGRPRRDADGKPMRYTLETAVAAVRAQNAAGTMGTAAAPGLPGWGERGAATRPGPAATPARPVDLSPVGSVNVAPAAMPVAPATGLNTLVSRTATGVNVRTPDGNVQFMPFSALPVSELVRLGVYTTTR